MKYFPGFLSRRRNGGSPFVETNVEVPQAEAVDRRTVALLRILLAFVAFSVTLIDPTEPQRFVELTYFLLAAYFVYSILLFIMAGREDPLIPLRWTHWLDVTWFTVITSLSNGPSSIFFFFFLFPTMVASFRWGFAEGMRVTGVCTILFVLSAYFFYRLPGPEPELNRFLIRPIYLLVFGFMTASWGGREVLYRRRLALFREVSRSSNPRFGIDQSLQSLTEKLRAHFDADLCLLKIENPTPAGKTLWISQAPSAPQVENAAEQLNTEYAIVFSGEVRGLREECHIADPATLEDVEPEKVDCRPIVRALKAKGFISMPILRHGSIFGVIGIASQRPAFDRTDLEFLYHLLNQVMPNIENTQLLDRLASQAAGQQRQKLSRDLHDTTVQPYIGLKLGLEALELKHDAGQPVGDDIRKLIALADTSIAEIRGFVRGLKGGSDEQVGGILVTALRQQAAKYREFYGISIDVDADDHLQVNDRLGAEVFQIIIEGLSNIRRHTGSKIAVVRIAHDRDTALRVEIENAPDGAAPANEFVPKSIAERTASLGGRADVHRTADITRISVEIPL